MPNLNKIDQNALVQNAKNLILDKVEIGITPKRLELDTISNS